MGLIDDLRKQFQKTSSDEIGRAIEELVSDAISRRRSHERRWFDNNFFDDGYHFRVVSKKTGRVIDHVDGKNGYVERAIPRASRQIRGVSNLLFSAEPYPVVYPERVKIEEFRNQITGKIDMDRYNEALESSKRIARKRGAWITDEWTNLGMEIKLINMLIKAAKGSVSYMQIYSDSKKNCMYAELFDSFDIVLYGDREELESLPFITKTKETDLMDIFKNTDFKPEMVEKLNPDNRYATSEIKEAYMRARYGQKDGDNKTGTVILKETFMKEQLTQENWEKAVKNDAGGAMEGKSNGDSIMRHVYSAGGVTLLDEYVDYDKYPFIDFRFEPGPIYQVPLIERFIPQNKSLDVVVTRLEKWVNAMIVGVYQQRKGENMQISNFPGGQLLQYETTPLSQMQTATVGNTPFAFLDIMNKMIDEQGATTAGGINVPQGVKSGVAIESVKATEYANLKISTMMLKNTIKRIAECMIERADKDYVEPKEVTEIEDGEPTYFDVIGARGASLRKQINQPLSSDTVTIDRKMKVRIEIEPGLGLTMQGKREAMQGIIKYMIELANMGILSAEPLKMVVKKFLDTFGYGNTQEFMEVLDQNPQGDMTEEQILKVKVAIIEALKDAGAVGPEMEQRLVDSTKLGVLETLKEAGMLNKEPDSSGKQPSQSISFKDLPPEGQAQLAAKAGIQITPSQIVQNESFKTVKEVKKMGVKNGKGGPKKL